MPGDWKKMQPLASVDPEGAHLTHIIQFDYFALLLSSKGKGGLEWVSFWTLAGFKTEIDGKGRGVIKLTELIL